MRVLGSWDDWTSPGRAMQPEQGWQLLALELPPGEHAYLLEEDGEVRIDDHNPLTSFRPSDQLEVSRLVVEDCEVPALEIEQLSVSELGLELQARFWAARGGGPLDPATIVGPGLAVQAGSPADGTIELSSSTLPRGRHSFVIEAADEQGQRAEARVSVFVDPVAASWKDAIVYQVMIDRFRGDAGAVLDAPLTPASRAGGTLDGVQAALEDGYFEQLGVSALWLSPVYRNPVEPREGTDGRLYEGYHGYWVEASREVEPRIGGEQALRSLIDAAHARGIAIILDLVPNHLYETNPVVLEHRDHGWFNEHEGPCVCGTPTCPWSELAEVCWFAPYLPDLRLEHPDAMDFSVGEIAWWVQSFDVDGVRIDAVPMMPRAASRRIVDAVRSSSSPGNDRLVLGEVFTGGGTAGVAGIRYYLGPDGLDSVFDFPFMWALRDLLAHESASFVELDAQLGAIDQELDGSGAVLGRMLGNHDTTRFVSEVVGDAGGDAWDEPAWQPESGEVLDRVALALTLQLTLPGMPVIYYGDELGVAGAGDPDNRRPMPDLATLSPARQALLDHARRLGRLRRCTPALRSDERRTLHVGADSYAYARVAGDRVALVLLSRADEPESVTLPGGSVPAGRYRDVLGSETIELQAGTQVQLAPRSARILLPEDDPCAIQ